MDPIPPLTEQVRQCLAGFSERDPGALAALYDLTAVRLVRYAVTITRHQHDAEDAVQSVLVRVATFPHLLRDADSPWPYLLSMVRNEALGVARRMRRCHVTGDLSDLVTRQKVDELEQAETHRQVWQALRTLPEEQVEVMVLKVWEGLTFAQIAEILGISPHTAASRHRYAIVKLAERLRHLQREDVHG